MLALCGTIVVESAPLFVDQLRHAVTKWTTKWTPLYNSTEISSSAAMIDRIHCFWRFQEKSWFLPCLFCASGILVFHFPQCPVKGCESASLWHCFDFPHCALFLLSFFPFQESGIVLTAFSPLCIALFWLDCKSLALFWQEGARWQKADAFKIYLKGPEMHILVLFHPRQC